jgi:hypothetical protein
MNVLIDKIIPDYRDVSTMEGYSFLVAGHKVEFQIVSGSTKSEQMILKGEVVLLGENLTTSEAEEKVKEIVKRAANDTN